MKLTHIKTLALYVIATILFILFLNFISGVLLELKEKFQTSQIEDERAFLPVYKDVEYGKMIFKEFNSLKTDYASYVGWKRKKYSGKTIHINGEGFRYDPKQKMHPENSVKNIFFFGGSTIWGSGVDDSATIPSIWFKLNLDRAVNVFNMGESGYDSRQSLESLINVLANNRKVDLAIFYVGVNEINRCRNVVTSNSHALEKQYLEKINEKISYTEAAFYYNLKIIFKRFLMKIKNESDSSYDLKCGCNNDRTDEVVKTMFANLKMAKYLVEQKGGKFLAVLQPVIYVQNPKKDYLDQYLQKMQDDRGLNYINLYEAYGRNRDYNMLINLTSSLNVRSNIYIDECHLNALGNTIIASKIDSVTKTFK